MHLSIEYDFRIATNTSTNCALGVGGDDCWLLRINDRRMRAESFTVKSESCPFSYITLPRRESCPFFLHHATSAGIAISFLSQHLEYRSTGTLSLTLDGCIFIHPKRLHFTFAFHFDGASWIKFQSWVLLFQKRSRCTTAVNTILQRVGLHS